MTIGKLPLKVSEDLEIDTNNSEKIEITQTDHLNNRLLNAFLNKINDTLPNLNINDCTSEDCNSEIIENKQEMENTHKCLIIGIGGVTNGGKTTLSEHLKNKTSQITIINMDDYYLDEEDHRHTYLEELKYNNYDIVTSVNFEAIHVDITSWLSINSQNVDAILIVEGILIYNYSPIQQYFTNKYYLTLEKQECYKRRTTRIYMPLQPDGYFDKVCWPCHLDYKNKLHTDKDIVYIDGTDDREDIYNRVNKDIGCLQDKQSLTSEQ